MPNYMFQLQSAVLSNPPPPPASNSDTLDNAALLFAGSVFNSQTHKLTTSSPTLQFKSLKPNPFKSCRRAFCGRFHGSPSASLHHEIPLGQVINWHNIISSTEPPPFNPPLLAEATRHEEHGDADLLGDDFDPLAGYENKDWSKIHPTIAIRLHLKNLISHIMSPLVVLKKLYNLVQLPSSIALTNLELPGNIRPSTH
ncbi:hypothetical protein PtB15_7B362 [Puccinia triticina]|nr:hypothetical protein PtB15_7B362 [Puccinia triticina]